MSYATYSAKRVPDSPYEWAVVHESGERLATCPDRWTASTLVRLLNAAADLDAGMQNPDKGPRSKDSGT